MQSTPSNPKPNWTAIALIVLVFLGLAGCADFDEDAREAANVAETQLVALANQLDLDIVDLSNGPASDGPGFTLGGRDRDGPHNGLVRLTISPPNTTPKSYIDDIINDLQVVGYTLEIKHCNTEVVTAVLEDSQSQGLHIRALPSEIFISAKLSHEDHHRLTGAEIYDLGAPANC